MGNAQPSKAWKQGSILPPADIATLLKDEQTPRHWLADDLYIVVSHSCDVARTAAVEPIVEIIRAVTIDQIDGNYTYGKSTRTLDIDNCPPANCPVRILIADRLPMAKALLSEPATGLDRSATELLARWVSRRYRRGAFPDQFNSRLLPARERTRRSLKNKGADLSYLLIWLYNDAELGAESVYEIELMGTLGIDDFEEISKRRAATQLLDEIAIYFDKCEGITVVDHSVRSEDDVSISDLHYFVPWDVEDLSLRSDTGALGPEP